MAKQKINPAQQLNTALSQTNSGSAGGTMYYQNIGGVKMLWLQSANTASSTTYSVTFPSGFFSSIQAITFGNIGAAGTSNGLYIVIGSMSTAGMQYYTGSNHQGCYLMVVGA